MAESDAYLKKTAKSLLLHKIEGDVPSVDMLKTEHTFIVDGMAYVRQIKSSGLTFTAFSTKLLTHILHSAMFASPIDVVFDVYIENSIKDVERQRRSSGEIVLKKSNGVSCYRQEISRINIFHTLSMIGRKKENSWEIKYFM